MEDSATFDAGNIEHVVITLYPLSCWVNNRAASLSELFNQKPQQNPMKSNLPVIATTFNRNELLQEAWEVIAYSQIRLGERGNSETEKYNYQNFFEKINVLQREQIRFSPKLDICVLDAIALQKSGKKIPHYLHAKMQDNYFYQIKMPVTLKSKVGWAFTRLECEIRFCDEERDRDLCPIVHDIFPKDKWIDVLNAGIECTVTLNENMLFAAQQVELAQEQTAVQFDIKNSLNFGPFHYRLRRPTIKARGILDTVCFWQMDGKEYVDEENVLLGVILMVPKKRTAPVNAVASAVACHDFQFLTADIFRNYFNDFDEKLKSLFRAGIPLEAHSCWQNILSA